MPVVAETDTAAETESAPAVPVEEPVTEAVRTEADEDVAVPEPLQRTSEPLPRRGPVTAPERSHYPRPTRKRDRPGPGAAPATAAPAPS